jgi:hypothetical protein
MLFLPILKSEVVFEQVILYHDHDTIWYNDREMNE